MARRRPLVAMAVPAVFEPEPPLRDCTLLDSPYQGDVFSTGFGTGGTDLYGEPRKRLGHEPVYSGRYAARGWGRTAQQVNERRKEREKDEE